MSWLTNHRTKKSFLSEHRKDCPAVHYDQHGKVDHACFRSIGHKGDHMCECYFTFKDYRQMKELEA